MWETIIVNPFTNALLFIYKLIGGNFGIAIILFTILIRVITHPLMASQIKGSTKMQELQGSKEWQDIQKKYKDDKEKLSQEQMKLYKEMGINPLGSCLPTLIQFPIIIGLYQSIISALAATPIELLNLSKHVYPGFINISSLIAINKQFLWLNLAKPDIIQIPYLPFGLPILAIIVVATTYLQSKLMTPPSTNPNDQGAAMGKAMNLYMPFFMGYLALTLASGLALYFVVSNIIGIIQYAAMGKIDIRNLLPGGKKLAAKR